MSEPKPVVRRRGRPPKNAALGRTAQIATRVTQDLKDALDTEAMRNGITQADLIDKSLRNYLMRPPVADADAGLKKVPATILAGWCFNSIGAACGIVALVLTLVHK